GRGRHLLGRRPGRRDDRRGKWGVAPLAGGVGPCPEAVSEGAKRTTASEASEADRTGTGAAAFFDLDKTLMEGSSALHFARAAYRNGMLSRRQLVRDGLANLRFRLRGSTDSQADQLRQRVLDSIAGQQVRDLARLGPEIVAGILPRVYREVLLE